MGKVSRLVALAAAAAAISVVAAQVVTAAPAGAKAGTSYVKVGGADVAALGTNVVNFTIPPGKFHITASVVLENFHYGPDLTIPDDIEGPAIRRVRCFLSAGGLSTGYAGTSLGAGGFATITMDGVVDASSSGPSGGTYIEVSCTTEDPSAIPPYAGVTIVADAVSAIVRY